MREEILRARHNLLTSQDSARVESVIRLLEQTYQRLENEAATTAALDAVAASLVSTSDFSERKPQKNSETCIRKFEILEIS